MSAHSRRPAQGTPPRAPARRPRIALNLRLLVVSEDFPGLELGAPAVAGAIARGLRAGGLPEPDQLALAGSLPTQPQLRALLDEHDLQARMLAARALVIASETLHRTALPASAAFELATRARQGGVPAYAVSAENTLDSFQARILDLQLILEASSPRALAGAGRRLAREVLAGLDPETRPG